MSPELNLVMHAQRDPESCKNGAILSETFYQLKVDDTANIEIIDAFESSDSGFLEIKNYHDDKLMINPESREWVLYKEHFLSEGYCCILGKIYLVPVKTETGKIKVLVMDNDFEEILSLTMSSGPSIYSYYGEENMCMDMGGHGKFYDDEGEYLDALSKLKEKTGLEINGFFIGVDHRAIDTEPTGPLVHVDIHSAIDLR